MPGWFLRFPRAVSSVAYGLLWRKTILSVLDTLWSRRNEMPTDKWWVSCMRLSDMFCRCWCAGSVVREAPWQPPTFCPDPLSLCETAHQRVFSFSTCWRKAAVDRDSVGFEERNTPWAALCCLPVWKAAVPTSFKCPPTAARPTRNPRNGQVAP